jgi:valyl-tRNA synthetase
MAAINKRKGELGASVGRGVKELALGANAATLSRLGPALGDLVSAVRGRAWELVERAELPDGEVEVVRCEVEPAAAGATDGAADEPAG